MKKSDLLTPFAWLYAAAAAANRALYEKGVFKSFDLGAPTVAVGNLTVGGTGKTPLVAFAARVLAERGEGLVCVLTRGYRRENERERILVSDGRRILADAKKAGDEPLELAAKLLGRACVVADADRAGAGKWARENLGAGAFVLDDAFQHPRVRRDLDLVCVDATNPFGNRRLLPAGILREPPPHLKRAGAIVVTRANLVGEKQVAELKRELSGYGSKASIFAAENKISALTELTEFNARREARTGPDQAPATAGEQRTKDEGRRTKGSFLAFCAIGNPENFFRQLELENFRLVATKKFPDHHFYTQKDASGLEAAAREAGATCLLTTAKDAVKLGELKMDLPCLVVETELVFDDEAGLKDLIRATAARRGENER